MEENSVRIAEIHYYDILQHGSLKSLPVLFFSLRDQIESVELISIKIVDSIMPVGIRILVLMPTGFFTL